ncbi:MAG TPA: hypothetical protein VGC34_13130 [Steroidobacteraceae bacterium]
MSSPRFETFLARLYSEPEFLEQFMRSPQSALTEAGLDAREQQAALTIDRPGLLMAARSYKLKRQAHRRVAGPGHGVVARLRGILARLLQCRFRQR